jgi:hypothetical protein
MEISEAEFVPPTSRRAASAWATQIVDRCFAPDSICSGEARLIAPLLRVLVAAGPPLASYISQALADLALFAGTLLKTIEFAGLGPGPLRNENAEHVAVDVAAEIKRSQDLLGLALTKFNAPSLISANLLTLAAVFKLWTPEPDEIKKHMLAAKADPQHAVSVCSLLGGGGGIANLVPNTRVECAEETGLWTGGSAATALVVWGSDVSNFDLWSRSEIARLWREAASSVGALVPIDALSREGQIRAIERLLDWGLASPENPLDLAVRLLKSRFAPELSVISWTDTYGQNVRQFVFGPQRNPLIRPRLDSDQANSLLIMSRSSMLFRQQTNLWRLFGLPDSGNALEDFARGHGASG